MSKKILVVDDEKLIVKGIRFSLEQEGMEVDCAYDGEEALEYARSLDMILLPYELAKGMKHTRELFASIRPGQSVGIFIGPEGGFEEEEVKKAVEAGAEQITLGRRILRTETAGMTVLSILMYLMEEE